MAVLERRLRLWSGLFIGAFVVMHLLNHTLGLASVGLMELARKGNAVIWHSVPGQVGLYGSLAVHFALALRSLYRRRTLRMPAWEAMQIALGLAIPFLLAGHVIGTRGAFQLLGAEPTYPRVLHVLWNSERLVVQQPVLLLVVWSHLVVGLHFWLRLRAGYARLVPALYAIAVLLPAFALAGFARGAMDITQAARNPAVYSAIFRQWDDAPAEQRDLIKGLESRVWLVLAGLLGTALLARQLRIAREGRGGTYRIDHPERPVVARRGQSILEGLRVAGVAHASVCGGRARCTTCRVKVLRGLEVLPEPRALEHAALVRLGTPIGVRLACQARPRGDVTIAPLLPATTTAASLYRPGGVQGRELRVAAMFIDLRGSTALGERRLPYDVVFILNQFFAEMSAALAATRGHYAQFSGDGLMALYGLRGGFGAGCRDALAGAVEMGERLERLNERLGEELEVPLRMGIGIHAGEAIVGTMGPPSSPNLSAIGDNVNIAARLEAQTKALDCVLVVSREACERAGVDLTSVARAERISVRGRDAPLDVYAVADVRAIASLIPPREGGQAEEQGARGA